MAQQSATASGTSTAPSGASPSFWSLVNPFNPDSPFYLLPGPSTTPKERQQGPSLGPGRHNVILTPGQQKSGQQAVADIPVAGPAITSADDFLQWISWIFHPLNILRAVEFLTGLFFLYIGLRSMLYDRSPTLASTGQGIARVTRQLTAASPAGRPLRQRQGRRMGKREGQREAARMEARREATRSERESSSRERASRESRAREHARTERVRR